MRIPLNRDYLDEHPDALGIARVLDVTASHALTPLSIPRLHGDPFDRLLVAQCAAESMRFVSADRMFRKYPIEVLW